MMVYTALEAEAGLRVKASWAASVLAWATL